MQKINDYKIANAPLSETRGEIQELSTADVEQVSGGFVEIIAMVAASNYAYYQYLKWADKI